MNWQFILCSQDLSRAPAILICAAAEVSGSPARPRRGHLDDERACRCPEWGKRLYGRVQLGRRRLCDGAAGGG